jgi:hypothetical protein
LLSVTSVMLKFTSPVVTVMVNGAELSDL